MIECSSSSRASLLSSTIALGYPDQRSFCSFDLVCAICCTLYRTACCAALCCWLNTRGIAGLPSVCTCATVLLHSCTVLYLTVLYRMSYDISSVKWFVGCMILSVSPYVVVLGFAQKETSKEFSSRNFLANRKLTSFFVSFFTYSPRDAVGLSHTSSSVKHDQLACQNHRLPSTTPSRPACLASNTSTPNISIHPTGVTKGEQVCSPTTSIRGKCWQLPAVVLPWV